MALKLWSRGLSCASLTRSGQLSIIFLTAVRCVQLGIAHTQWTIVHHFSHSCEMRAVGVLDFCASRLGLYSFVLSRLVPTSKKVGEVVGICFELLASLLLVFASNGSLRSPLGTNLCLATNLRRAAADCLPRLQWFCFCCWFTSDFFNTFRDCSSCRST